MDYTTILREGGEVADDSASFSPAKDVFSAPEDRPSTPVPGRGDSSSPDCDFGRVVANDAPMAGQKRRPISPDDELRRKAPKHDSAASLRRGGKSSAVFKDVVVQTRRGPPREEVSPFQTRSNWQPLLGRVMSLTFLLSRTIW